MNNPIVGIYELKKFMGLKDLPRSDVRVARVLRNFDTKSDEILVNFDEETLKFWEKIWCSYSDCVFIDLNAHHQSHEFRLRGVGISDNVQTKKVQLTFKLKVDDPIAIVKDQITNTYNYMSRVLESLVKQTFRDGALVSENQFEALLRRNISLSNEIDKYFILSDFVVELSFSNMSGEIANRRNEHSIEQDMNALLEIAKRSDLDNKEEERLKKLFFDFPESL